MREGSRLYKRRKKLEKEEVIEIPQPINIIQPVVPESQPEVLDDDEYKECSDCNEFKSLNNFYLNRYGNHIKRCKECHMLLNRKKAIEKRDMNGGVDLYYKEPNRYIDEQQRSQVFILMKAFGWIFDESTGVWNKAGLKENGVFINFTPSDKPKRKSYFPGQGRKIKKGVWNSVDKIVKLIEEGYNYRDVADVFDCSHTTIRKVISDYRNGKIK
jgi:hypothetical protein